MPRRAWSASRTRFILGTPVVLGEKLLLILECEEHGLTRVFDREVQPNGAASAAASYLALREGLWLIANLRVHDRASGRR
jgi:hypothetical protein